MTALLSLLVAATIPNPAADINWPPTSTAMWSVQTFTFVSEKTKNDAKEAVTFLKTSKWNQALSTNLLILGQMPPEVFNGKPLPYVGITTAGQKPPVQKGIDGWQWELETAWLQVVTLEPVEALKRFRKVAENKPELFEAVQQGMAFAYTRAGDYKRGLDQWRLAGTLTPGQEKALIYAQSSGQDSWLALHNLAMGATLSGQISSSGSGGGLPNPNGAKPSGDISGAIEANLILAETALRQKDAAQVKLYANKLSSLLGKDAPPIYKAMSIELLRAASQL